MYNYVYVWMHECGQVRMHVCMVVFMYVCLYGSIYKREQKMPIQKVLQGQSVSQYIR